MIDDIVQTTKGQTDRKWQRMRLTELGLMESDLETVIFQNHELLCLERIGLIVDRIHVVRQVGIKGVMGDQKYPDLMFLTDRGDVGIVEVKRFGNRELKGRHVISQVLDYGATLGSLDASSRSALFTQGHEDHESLEDIARKLTGDLNRARWVAKSYRNRLAHGQLHYLIVCDEAPQGLTDWIRSASRSDATDYQISVLEVSPYIVQGSPDTIMWLSQPVVRTETIHRTTVQVIRNDDDGALAVNISSDSPETIAERSESDEPAASAGEQKLRQILECLSESLTLPATVLLEALSIAHAQAMQEDWSWALQRFEHSENKVPIYLRGGNKTGLVEGRFGINLAKPWKPGIFVGIYFSSQDHFIEPVGKDTGGDFAVILDIANSWGKEINFWETSEYQRLLQRLREQAHGWTVSQGNNPWHPLMIHRPLSEIMKGAATEPDIVQRWHDYASEGLELMLAGEEFKQLGDRQARKE